MGTGVGAIGTLLRLVANRSMGPRQPTPAPLKGSRQGPGCDTPLPHHRDTASQQNQEIWFPVQALLELSPSLGFPIFRIRTMKSAVLSEEQKFTPLHLGDSDLETLEHGSSNMVALWSHGRRFPRR